MKAPRVMKTWTALAAAALIAVPLWSEGIPVATLGKVQTVADAAYAFADDSSHAVACRFSSGSIDSISARAPQVKPESRWQGRYKFQFVRWYVTVEVRQGGHWSTVATAKRLAKANFRGWTGFASIRPFTSSALGGSGNTAYRVVEELKWYDPQVKGKVDTQASHTMRHYRYGYHTSSRSYCQNRAPVAYSRAASTYPGEGNAITVAGTDPDGDSPLSLKVLGATMNGSPVSGFAGSGGAHSIQLFPTAGEVGNVVDVQFELIDPAGAASAPATVAVTVNGSASPSPTPTPTPSATSTTTPTPTPGPTTTVTVTPTPTASASVAPPQIATPSASDHNASGAGYNGAIQVTFTDPSPGSGTLTEIDYALNGTSTSGSWTPAGSGVSETKTISGLTNGSNYTVALRACNSASMCSTWSAASNQASPYTVPAKPSVSASASGLTITASWSGGGGGGRSINHYSVCFQGVSCANYASAGSAGHAYSSYSTTYTVTVTAVDSAGQTSAAASASATTGMSPHVSHWETTGSVAHTWTNYTNAGGTQGPSINSNQTVDIECRLTGFKVAGGNTWWYRIYSSPWNDQYYVSADAFYNNGQTSGSLSGTPFVDANVPTC